MQLPNKKVKTSRVRKEVEGQQTFSRKIETTLLRKGNAKENKKATNLRKASPRSILLLPEKTKSVDHDKINQDRVSCLLFDTVFVFSDN